MLIQMPLLFALYPVIYDIEHFVPAMAHDPESVNRFLSIPDLTVSPWTMLKNSGDFGTPALLIIITAIALPVLSGLSQYLSIRLSQAISGQQMDQDNPMAGTMKSMNIMMPLFSVYIVFTLPTGIGLYWIVSAVVRCIQQIMINKHLSKMSVEDILEQNREKAEEKAKKRGEKAEKIGAMAQTNTKSIKEAATQSVSGMSEKEREAKIEKAKKNAAGAEAGSLAAKANMVKKFNENN